MKIAYWSLFHGQTGTTTNLLLIHSVVGLRTPKTQIILSNQYSFNLLEKYIGITKDNTKGLDKLMISVRNRTLRFEHIEDYTESMMNDRQLDIVTETIHSRESAHKNNEEIFVGLIELSDKAYDYVVIDMNAGVNDVNKVIFDSADKIVVNLNQNSHVINETLNQVKKLGLKDKVVYVIGNYDGDGALSKKNIERHHGIKLDAVLYRNRHLKHSANNGQVIDFVNLNLDARKDDDTYPLIKELKQLTEDW